MLAMKLLSFGFFHMKLNFLCNSVLGLQTRVDEKYLVLVILVPVSPYSKKACFSNVFGFMSFEQSVE